MSAHGSDTPGLTPAPWLARLARAGQPESAVPFTYVLDADDDLAEEFDPRARFAAREVATARMLHAEPGDCDLQPWFDAVGPGPGLLVLEGLMTIDTEVAGRTVTELVGTGDLLQPDTPHPEEMLDRSVSWKALALTQIALLNDEFAVRMRPWPQVARALLRRTERRAAELAELRAISSHPRLEVRLALLLWHLAARWGRVERSGLRLILPLTHRLLGQMVAAERPSISHALRRLSDAGLITGCAGDWHLRGSLDDHLDALAERTTTLAAHRDRLAPSVAR
jgi:CRP/FNR family transcriptional regulator, cyclic AMP receptor protein